MASKALKFVTKDGIGRGLREAGARLKESSELMEVRVLHRLHVAWIPRDTPSVSDRSPRYCIYFRIGVDKALMVVNYLWIPESRCFSVALTFSFPVLLFITLML
jgi:hypothetical protein